MPKSKANRGAPVWVIEPVSEWPTKAIAIHYLKGYERAPEAPEKQNSIALVRTDDRTGKVYYRLESMVIDRLPVGANGETFEEIYN